MFYRRRAGNGLAGFGNTALHWRKEMVKDESMSRKWKPELLGLSKSNDAA
jgi:hypothetical protein